MKPPILSQHAEELWTCMDVYGDNWQAYFAAAEYAYYAEFNALPPWGIFIERVEIVNHDHIFIHHDWGKKQ